MAIFESLLLVFLPQIVVVSEIRIQQNLGPQSAIVSNGRSRGRTNLLDWRIQMDDD